VSVRRIAFALLAAASVSGCEVYEPAPPEEIARARYESPEPPSVTLISMVKTSSGRSAHSALLVNGSERVLFDPAGTFKHPSLPRAGDIHYGMSPKYVEYYERYHARFSHYVQTQTVPVSRDVADRIIANARVEGKSFKMTCSIATADVLRPVPPFTSVRSSWFPETLRQDFARLPGVEDGFRYETDIGQNSVWETMQAEEASAALRAPGG
jgi:hypothetical protein